MKRKPARLYPKEDDIIEKIKPYLTKEVGTVGIIIIIFLLSIIFVFTCKNAYNIETII
jgi:hypothetical protein